MPGKVLVGPNPLRQFEDAFRPALEAAGYEVVFPRRHAQMTLAELRDQLPGCVGSLAGSEPYTRDVLAEAKAAGLRCVSRAGVGYDGVDIAAATDLGIPVCYAPGTNHEAVGEFALALMLALVKSLLPQDAGVRRGEWPRRAYLPLRGQTLAVFGLGRTGKATARRARAFDMTVLAVDPVWDAEFADTSGVRRATPAEAFAEADIVSLHVPLTPDTRHLIRAETIAAMKPTAFVVNTSRGPTVHEADLAAALTAGRLAGAGLDVFADEPLPADSPLRAAPNCLLTAHTAGVDRQSLQDMARVGADALIRVLRGERPMELTVNPEVWGR
jgi:phosphoglycerate dehydrogenase-like enzyme